jgi:hypothetical protein
MRKKSPTSAWERSTFLTEKPPEHPGSANNSPAVADAEAAAGGAEDAAEDAAAEAAEAAAAEAAVAVGRGDFAASARPPAVFH